MGSYQEQLTHFFFFYSDWFRCHQNHVFILFLHVIYPKSFWLWFQIDQLFPENMLPRSFPVLEGRLNLSFLLPKCWFQSQQVENLCWSFLIHSVQWNSPSCLGGWGREFSPSWDLSQTGPWCQSLPSSMTPSAFTKLQYRFPGTPSLPIVVGVSWAHTPIYLFVCLFLAHTTKLKFLFSYFFLFPNSSFSW